jgi:hypothetical protein
MKRKRGESCHDMLVLLGTLASAGICALLLEMARILCLVSCR